MAKELFPFRGAEPAGTGSAYPPRLSVNGDIAVRQPSANCGLMHCNKLAFLDDQLELGWLLDREIAGLRTTQNLVDIFGGSPK
jgi:hypothetical protein